MTITVSNKKARGTIVATDASVLYGHPCHVGMAYLDDLGDWWLLSYQQPPDRNDTSLSMHAELKAIRAAWRRHKHPITVLSDSRDAVGLVCAWQQGDLRPVPNYEGNGLNTFARRIAEDPERIRIEWVRGHAGHVLHDGADRLSRLASTAARDQRPSGEVRGVAKRISAYRTEVLMQEEVAA